MILASLLLCVPVTTATAGDDEAESSGVDYAVSGIYLGAAFGLGFENYDGLLGQTDYETGMGFDAFLGYRINRWVAVEFQYEYIDRVDSRHAGPEVKTDLQTFGGNVKGYFPVGRWQPFLLGGLGITRSATEIDKVKDSDSTGSARFGGGVEWYWTKNFALTASASYVLPFCKSDSECDYRYVSAAFGGQWRF